MQRIILGLEYQGQVFCGWQTQTNAHSVQATLEAALARIAGHHVRVHAAGRTDTGVHASLQILHFDTTAKRPLSAWTRGVNSYLPASISVRWAEQTDAIFDGFHARFSALQRHYQYLIHTAPNRSALWGARSSYWHTKLDIFSMQAAGQCLLGEHDFSSFRSSECQAKSPVKNISALDIHRPAEDLILINISANAFLHHMVRNIAGCLIYIGAGRWPAHKMQTVLDSKNRVLAAPTAPANGLTLIGVDYPTQFKLPENRRPAIFL
ncbi:MAG: hypothetical protein RLZZ502_1866 [Pseudomonadota bacterium]|jgi:tRNA pseudouridine38-40 synthase